MIYIMISNLSKTNSFENENPGFPEIEKNSIECQIQEILEKVNAKQLSENSTKAKYHLNQASTLKFALRIIEYLFEEGFILNEKIELEATSFFKVYLLKSNFLSFGSLVNQIFKSISGSLKKSLDSQLLLSKFFSFLGLFSNFNSGKTSEQSILFDGVNQVFAIKIDKDKGNMKMYLNRDFTCVICFKIDQIESQDREKPVTIMSFYNEFSEQGYCVYLLNDVLWFRHLLPIKGPEMLNEFPIFEKISEFLSLNWNTFFFECQYNAVGKCSNLKFQLNNKVFLMNKGFEDAFFRCSKQVLTVLNGAYFELSAFCVMNLALNAEKIRALQTLLQQNGLVTIELVDIFIKILENVFESDGIWVFYHPFCETKLIGDELNIIDWAQSRMVPFYGTIISAKNTNQEMTNDLIKSRLFESTLALLNFTSNENDFKELLKIIKNFFVNQTFVEEALLNKNSNFCTQFISSLLVTKKYTYFDKRTIESLFYILRNQNEKYQVVFLRYLFLDFHFINKCLSSEPLIIAYFDEVLKFIDKNIMVLIEVDLNKLARNALLFLDHDNSLSTLKALYCLKITLQGMRLGETVGKFKLEIILKYFFFCVKNQSVINLAALKIISNYSKIKNIPKKHHNLYINSLSSVFFASDDFILLKKIIKLIKNVDLVDHTFAIFLCRKKFVQAKINDKTKKVFWNYLTVQNKPRNTEIIIKFLLRKCFQNLPKEGVFSNEVMLIDKNGPFDLLLEVSLLAEFDIIQKLVQCFLIAFQNASFNFAEFSEETNFLNWVLTLLFKLQELGSQPLLFDLTMKLLVTYSTAYYKGKENIDYMNTISELVNLYSFEIKDDRLKFLVFNSLLEEFNRNEIMLDTEYNLNCFVIFSYKYYRSNLASGPFEDLYISCANNFLEMAHRTINLNPMQNLPSYLTEEIGNLFNERKRFVSSLVNSTRLPLTIIQEAKEGYCCSLKFLTLMAMEIHESFATKVKVIQNFETVFEFLNAYFYRLNYYLDKNKKKLKPEKVYLLESTIYSLSKYLFGKIECFRFMRESVESLFFFSSKSKGEIDINRKILKELGAPINIGHSEFIQMLATQNQPRLLAINEYSNLDYEEGKMNYFLESVGKINDAISSAGFTQEEMFMSLEQAEKFISLIDFEEGQQNYIDLISYASYQSYISLSKLNKLYNCLYKRQFDYGGQLSDRALLARSNIKLEYDPNCFPYEQNKEPIILYKQNQFVTKSYQKPFIKKCVNKYYQSLKFVDDFKLSSHFSFQNYFRFWDSIFYQCYWVLQLYLISSYVLIDVEKKKIRIFKDHNLGIKNPSVDFSNLQIKKYKTKIHKRIVEKIAFQDIEEVLLFKFLQQRNSVLILLKSKQQVLLNLLQEAHAINFIKIVTSIIGKASSTKTEGLSKMLGPQDTSDRWINHKISNFELLMEVNTWGSRSFEDYSQYPVFPLLVKKFDNVIVLRELEKPIGMNSEEKVIANYQKIYESEKGFGEKSFFYGSHYSCPANIFNFLIRKIPETYGSKAIHNNTYDVADRIFHSFQNMVKNIIEDGADVREMIPELYYLPEILLNLNNFDFKINQKGEQIHHVLLPEACKSNPYRFIHVMRQLLESPMISLKIGLWIDLIFGVKQTGPKALESKNLFYPLTYEANFKDLKFENEEELKSTFLQIYNYGQVPMQVYTKAHPNKRITGQQQNLSSLDSKTKYFMRYRDLDQSSANPVVFVKKMKEKRILESKIIKRLVIVKSKSVEIWRFKIKKNVKNGVNPYEMVKEHNFLTEQIKNIFFAMGGSRLHQDVVELHSENRMFIGGILNGSILIFNYKSDKLIAKQNLHEKMIVMLKVTDREQLVSVDSLDIIKLWEFDPKINLFIQVRMFSELFKQKIQQLSFCQDDPRLMCINTECSIEIRMRDDFATKLLTIDKSRVLKDKDCNPGKTQAYLVLGYVNCVVFYAHFAGKNHLFTFSMLGQVIGYYVLENSQESTFNCLEFVSDECFRKHLMIVNQKGDVFLFDLPFFEFGRKINSSQNNRIKHMSLFLKKKLAMIVDDKGYIDILSSSFEPTEIV